MRRDELVEYLDDLLQIEAIEDTSNNGLQVEGAAEIRRLAFAVDASLAAFDGARAAGAQMLLVHHGLFWSKPLMVTGLHRRRLGLLVAADLSLYAAHLPLDFHPELGNNATLARWLGLAGVEPFGQYKGQPAGYAGRLPEPLSLEALVSRVEASLGEPVSQVWSFGKSTVETVGIISGGAARFVDQAAAAGVDAYLTGETSHGAFHDAQELGMNVIFGGHYATETAGLKALAEHLATHFGLETVFLDLPTGA
ncbi:MAG: Nif3-like dinuclear metal center hexameric protein [Chloroflexi bacterium]|nr:MAG: Nif3-like dinuclear metal center hexameric protein [Chloroflexota bacterium]